jgi:hypothetical protein
LARLCSTPELRPHTEGGVLWRSTTKCKPAIVACLQRMKSPHGDLARALPSASAARTCRSATDATSMTRSSRMLEAQHPLCRISGWRRARPPGSAQPQSRYTFLAMVDLQRGLIIVDPARSAGLPTSCDGLRRTQPTISVPAERRRRRCPRHFRRPWPPPLRSAA